MRNKLGQFIKGMISPNKGKKFVYKARPNAIGRKAWNMGKRLSKEHVEKIRIAHLGKVTWNKGTKGLMKPNSGSFTKNSTLGEKNVNWKGGISKESDKIRHSIEGKLWRNSVFARDGYTCQKTGIKGGVLVAHHILNFAQFPELRFAIDNGITLSKKSHLEFHKIYGKRNNTAEQLYQFVGQNL